MLSRMTFLVSSVVLAILALTIRPGLEDIILAVLLGRKNVRRMSRRWRRRRKLDMLRPGTFLTGVARLSTFFQEESYRS